MDFYNCPYVVVIPFRNGNEYDEGYGCGITERDCKCCECNITPGDAERMLAKEGTQ